MLAERRCGLKYWDKVEQTLGKEVILERTVEIHNQYPDIWGNKAGTDWRNCDWAIGNAVRELYCAITKKNGEYQMSWNINDVLTEQDIQYIQQKCGYVGKYIPCWPRD